MNINAKQPKRPICSKHSTAQFFHLFSNAFLHFHANRIFGISGNVTKSRPQPLNHNVISSPSFSLSFAASRRSTSVQANRMRRQRSTRQGYLLWQSDRKTGTRFNRIPVFCLSTNQSQESDSYSTIRTTAPAPTVWPPSRIAKRRPCSMAIGVMISTSISTLSPGMTISTPSGSLMEPVTSVVRK